MKKILLGLLILSALFFTPLAYAGGAGVYATTYATEDPHWNIVRVYFDQPYNCKGIQVSFKFDSPEDGDIISGTDGPNSSTITEGASYETVGDKQYLRCSTYTKVYSKELKWNRTFNINFSGPVQGSRQIAVSFGYGLNNSHILLLPWEGSSSYAPPSTPSPTPKPELTLQPSPKQPKPITVPKPIEASTPQPTSKPKETEKPKSDETEKLNSKIASLEAKLVESEKKQSFLEQRINDLVTFIKNLFPFFR